MRKHVTSMESPKQLKQKLMATLSMLLVSALLATTTSYAWLVMSIAPEVTAISTSVGANGSLEIALLDTETRQNMSSIKSGVGDSLSATKSAGANNTWGNLLDLSFDSYGLDGITLLPARLNAIPKESGEGYTVDGSLLQIPTYGSDGRIIRLEENAVTAVYNAAIKEFNYVLGEQDFGVRAIGTAESVGEQESALAQAKGNIVTYTNSAQNKAKSSLAEYGNALFQIMLLQMTDPNATYTETDLDSLKGMVYSLKDSVNYIDLALRQGIVAYAASAIVDEDVFTTVRSKVQDTSKALSTILAEYGAIEVPAEYNAWIGKQEAMSNNVKLASNICDRMLGGTYSWTQFKEVIDLIMSTDGIYIDGVLFSQFDPSSFVLGQTMEMSLAPGSGVLVDIAEFAGNYSAAITVMIVNVEIATIATEGPHLTTLSALVNTLEAVDGAASGRAIELTTTYGYAMDLAFRCNAESANLLLQTIPEQRIYSDSSSTSTLGGGSFMEFASSDNVLSIEQQIQLMDAVRVGFLDDKGDLLGVAKLNTSNRTMEDTGIKAPLYLYDYSFSEETEDKGAMIMGERRKTDPYLTSLQMNVPKALTVMVWLDGDLVDNTMVSATESTSLTGTLNIQFATDAELVPAANSDLMTLSTDKTTLVTGVAAAEQIIAQGQGTYSTVSWNAFTSAYAYAYAIANNDHATDNQISKAVMDLTKAAGGLKHISHEMFTDVIADYREFMGETGDLARYVVVDEFGNYKAIDPYTEQQKDNKVGEIYQVDYAKNLQDEGNDVLTPIYTDASWQALAGALYDAEAINMQVDATNAELDAAILALDVAKEALQRRVFFIPYDYNGTLFYFAISEETDTYGKWYDPQFKRIVDDLTILKLDAYAELATIAEIEEETYFRDTNQNLITPYLEIYDGIYPELRVEEIKAIQWSASPNLFMQAISQSQTARLRELRTQATNLGVDAVITDKATAALDKYGFENREAADAIIAELEAAVDAKYAELYPEEEPTVNPATDPMTSDQRIVLTTAVNAAKSVKGYEDAENTAAKLVNLRIAAEEVETILAQGGVTMKQADDALTALNAQLVENGQKEVTAYNTLTYHIPVGSEVYDVVYEVESPETILYLTGNTGSGQISAVILTENGIVYTATKDVTVYVKSDGAYITDGIATEENPTTIMTEKTQINIQAVLKDALRQGEVADVGPYDYYLPHEEDVDYCTWASSNINVLSVSGSGKNATVNAYKPGSAQITVSVRTVQGNTYAAAINVTVEAAPSGN